MGEFDHASSLRGEMVIGLEQAVSLPARRIGRCGLSTVSTWKGVTSNLL